MSVKSLRFVFLITVLSIITTSIFAQNYQLHTVYVYSFIRYIQWPDESGDFTIGVLGDSEIIDHLKKMAESKKAGARRIVIKEFPDPADIVPTDIIYISKSSSGLLSEIKDDTMANHTLIISEKEGMGMEGSAINFIERNGKLAFELNKSSVENAGLKVSTELSRLAIIL